MNYIKECLRTEVSDKEYDKILKDLSVKDIRLFHGIIGLNTEVGEISTILKERIFYRKELDPVDLIDELGDLLWYFSLICDVLGVSMEQIQKANIDKLMARYPDKFDSERAKNRHNLESK